MKDAATCRTTNAAIIGVIVTGTFNNNDSSITITITIITIISRSIAIIK